MDNTHPESRVSPVMWRREHVRRTAMTPPVWREPFLYSASR